MSTATPAQMQPLPAPGGLPRGVVVLLGLASAVVVVAGMRAASSLIGPILLALVVTIAVQPLRDWLGRHLPAWASTLLCLLVVNALVLGLGVALVVATARFATLLREYEAQFHDLVADLADRMHDLGISGEQVGTVTGGFDLSKLTDVVTGALSGALGFVSGLVFILALVLFMTVDGGSFPRRLAVASQARPVLVAAMADFAHDTRRYLLVSTAFGLNVAVFDTLALWVMDIPAPLLWGPLAFLTNYIPNIGFVIGLVPRRSWGCSKADRV